MAIARGYILDVPEGQQFRGQAALIVEAMKASPDTPKTTAEIANAIKAKLQTRQEPERVVAFYMTTWKRKDWVKVQNVEVTDSVAQTSNAADTAPQNIHEEVAPIEADKHTAIQTEVAVNAIHEFPNLRGKKLSEAVVAVIEYKAKNLTIGEITQVLNDNGYDFRENQVVSAVGNLVRQERVVKHGDKVGIAG